MISGLIVISLMLGFFCITCWAWSSHKLPAFDEAAQLPMQDEHQPEQRA
jgi:cbb3-type cytochrome oxidase subunit 3